MIKSFSIYKVLALGGCMVLLATIYITQQFNYLHFFSGIFGDYEFHEFTYFIFNKSIRFFLNDTIMVLVIWLIFSKTKYVKLALFVELFGLVVLLPLYFLLKLNLEGTSEISSPLLSFIHRLIINPTLLILLIPAIYFQESRR